MKRQAISFGVFAPLLSGLLCAAASSHAADPPPKDDNSAAVSTEIQNVEGTIEEVTESGARVLVPPSTNAVRYRFDETTVYMNEQGGVIDSEKLSVGSTITIRPTVKSGQLFARTVILHRDSAEAPPTAPGKDSVKDPGQKEK